jgi:tryptophanyl-tRNA synthetase
MATKKRILSGMQATGHLHLGNWEGALKNWARVQHEYESFHFVANWHSLTTIQDPGDTDMHREFVRSVATDFIAGGLDPEVCTIFVQSDILEHAELHLLFSMITNVGKLERVPTYKEKREQLGIEAPSYGLLGYPVLQAADILIYRADYVPVGQDQEAHLELSREIARSFNYLFGEVFPEPQVLLSEFPIVPGLDGRKMSKSYGNTILMRDSADEVDAKVKTMFTDPQRIHKTDKGHPDECPVHELHKMYSRERFDVQATVHDPCAAGDPDWACVKCKKALAESINVALEPVRAKREEILGREGYLDEILDAGAEKARAVCRETMSMVREAMKIGR